MPKGVSTCDIRHLADVYGVGGLTSHHQHGHGKGLWRRCRSESAAHYPSDCSFAMPSISLRHDGKVVTTAVYVVVGRPGPEVANGTL